MNADRSQRASAHARVHSIAVGCCAFAWALAVSSAHASDARDVARRYFEAGAAAYAAGDYIAAVQAFDAAYRAEPVPAIAFSLAQAERREYFASQQPAHLTRAIELFRKYLAEVPRSGRREDATDALAQLEPIALAQHQAGAPAEADAAAAKTRVMVRCQAEGARVALDGQPGVASPLIAETSPGPHRVEVTAPGFFPVAQSLTAVANELVPIEVTLREQPALLVLDPSADAALYVDGVVAPQARATGHLSLRSGRHSLAFAKPGYRPYVVSLTLARGETHRVVPNLRPTGQRVAAVTLLVAGSATLAAGLVFTGLALHAESDARDIADARRSRAISPAERRDYEDTVDARNRLRVLAVAGLSLSMASLLTGFLLYSLDARTPEHATPELALSAVDHGVHVQLSGPIRF